MTQHEIIIRELKRRWLTPMDALKVAGTMKLATRIGEIKEARDMRHLSPHFRCSWYDLASRVWVEGYRLIDKWVETPTGKKVKAYRLVKA